MDKKIINAWFWLIVNALFSMLNVYFAYFRTDGWFRFISLVCALINIFIVVLLAHSIYIYNRRKEK